MSHTMMKEALRLRLKNLRTDYLRAVLKAQDELDRLEALDAMERIYPAVKISPAVEDEKTAAEDYSWAKAHIKL